MKRDKTPCILTIVGARPQFIKAATVSRALASYPEVRELIVHTGQHYDENMSEIFFGEMQIPAPTHRLNIGSASHGAQTGAMLEGIERIMLTERPDAVLVYGDTNSTLAGALAAAKMHVPVAHVEAGLRSFNRRMPEEVNRVVADHLSALHLVPTETGMQNLAREGISGPGVHLVGDVMYDATLHYGDRRSAGELLARHGVLTGAYVLATIHRAENTDDVAKLRGIVAALEQVAEAVPVILPLHPRTRAALGAAGIDVGRVLVIEAVGYLDMLALERSARLIVTDSGGVQKEAFFHRVPCVTVRTETEWVELVETGWNRLPADLSTEAIVASVNAALEAVLPADPGAGLFGGGKAAEVVAARLVELVA